MLGEDRSTYGLRERRKDDQSEGRARKVTRYALRGAPPTSSGSEIGPSKRRRTDHPIASSSSTESSQSSSDDEEDENEPQSQPVDSFDDHVKPEDSRRYSFRARSAAAASSAPLDESPRRYSFRSMRRYQRGESRAERMKRRAVRKREMGLLSQDDHENEALDQQDPRPPRRQSRAVVDYKKFYMPSKAKLDRELRMAKASEEYANSFSYRPGKWKSPKRRNGAPARMGSFGPGSDSDDNRESKGQGGSNLGPSNIMHLLHAQQESILRELPEADRAEFLQNNRALLSNSTKELADTDPLVSDDKIDFDLIGGLDQHVSSLKEMVVMPLLYPEGTPEYF
ncbi:MAG: hypothetical protein SGCHY_001746 [Lobulomycetales sp.]